MKENYGKGKPRALDATMGCFLVGSPAIAPRAPRWARDMTLPGQGEVGKE